MKRSFLAVLVLVCLTVLLTGFAQASYELSGQVVDDTGEGIPGVKLLIRADDTKKSVTTDDEGYWTAEAEGEAIVSAEKTGYIFWPKQQIVTSDVADDVEFWGVTNKLAGQVVIDGKRVNRPVWITVETPDGTELPPYKSNSSGWYTLPLEDFQGLEWIRVIAASGGNYSSREIERMDLIARFIIEEAPLETRFLPNIDLYSYGMKLLDPEDNGTVYSYPYEVKISEYQRDVEGLYYQLYFHDLDHNYLGHSDMHFTGGTFTFDGTLEEGQMPGEEDTIWYVAGIFWEDGIKVSVDTFGDLV
ncbi:MAG: carboxypeptidase regulatory-like domain-containing protein, partial [Firmicutes bacterium]|nr:carboxypeptidase regulatory-like domain-containing protein [Bacillota bacterium]